ncbi:DUF6093 family protein [Streptomyces filamentosus]|uniref:Uncharacterized protein n=1 Tax=Streptomyces filamentosus TaxID=67294 RepID=A0A919EPX5_STRFL|nr:DUF6093 family protein [Streptomyces filamentosus]GHG05683.1 hypothetical protein GCM10017667_40700 [Streptomyces filamentosus]
MTTPVDPLARARELAEARICTDTVKIYTPGVFNPDTWESTPHVVLWEGPGAILPDREADVAVTVQDGQGTPMSRSGRYRLLTPVSAPEHTVTLTVARDPDAAGRMWRDELAERSSMPVLRLTWLRYDATANGGN